MFNRNFLSILVTNVVLGVPMPMLILLGALAGTSLAADPAIGTLTLSVQMVAGIVTAGPLSRYMASAGRRRGFLLVAGAMFIGGVVAVLSMMLNAFWLLCVAHFVMGAALIGVNFLRFAASEVVSERYKADAIAYTLASGLVAALIGPTVFEMSRDLLPIAYTGAYASIALLGALGTLPVMALRLSDVKPSGHTGRSRPWQAATTGSTGRTTSTTSTTSNQTGSATRQALTASLEETAAPPTGFFHTLNSRPGIAIAIVSAVAAQAIMILLMVPTPLAMLGEGFLEVQAADVIRWHVIAMFAPGLVTGTLIRRFDSIRIILAGMVLLMLAAAIALSSVGLSAFYLSLICLGIGWNFGFIGGTQLLQSELLPQEKGRFQGINDTLIALSSALASLAAGMLFQAHGWTVTLSVAIPFLLVALLILTVQIRKYHAAIPAPDYVNVLKVRDR